MTVSPTAVMFRFPGPFGNSITDYPEGGTMRCPKVNPAPFPGRVASRLPAAVCLSAQQRQQQQQQASNRNSGWGLGRQDPRLSLGVETPRWTCRTRPFSVETGSQRRSRLAAN